MRFPPDPKQEYGISFGMSVDACDAVFQETPEVRFCMSMGVNQDGQDQLVYANPRDARSVIILTVKNGGLVDACWFGTGESLLLDKRK